MALTITGLSKTYPNGVKALKNLSLTIGNNMFGLLGPNGAGKSTLMRTVATLQDPDSGSILLASCQTGGFVSSILPLPSAKRIPRCFPCEHRSHCNDDGLLP
jgi:ABC-type Fe3+/spermidine/putrescine transport system ATPase subunit